MPIGRQLSPEDQAAVRAAQRRKKQPAPARPQPQQASRPARLPRQLAPEDRAAARQAASRRRVAALPMQLPEADRRAAVLAAAQRAGTARARTVAAALGTVGVDGLRDDVKLGLLEDTVRALGRSVRALGQPADPDDEDLLSRLALGLGLLAAPQIAQRLKLRQPPGPPLDNQVGGARQLPREAYRMRTVPGPRTPAGAQAALDLLGQELNWRKASEHSTYPPVDPGRARARNRQLATKVSRGDLRYLARQIGSLDPRQAALQRAAGDLFSARRPVALEQLFTATFQKWKQARWV